MQFLFEKVAIYRIYLLLKYFCLSGTFSICITLAFNYFRRLSLPDRQRVEATREGKISPARDFLPFANAARTAKAAKQLSSLLFYSFSSLRWKLRPKLFSVRLCLRSLHMEGATTTTTSTVAATTTAAAVAATSTNGIFTFRSWRSLFCIAVSLFLFFLLSLS